MFLVAKFEATNVPRDICLFLFAFLLFWAYFLLIFAYFFLSPQMFLETCLFSKMFLISMLMKNTTFRNSEMTRATFTYYELHIAIKMICRCISKYHYPIKKTVFRLLQPNAWIDFSILSCYGLLKRSHIIVLCIEQLFENNLAIVPYKARYSSS